MNFMTDRDDALFSIEEFVLTIYGLIRSIFTVLISLLLVILILNTELLVDFSSPIRFMSSSLILLGFICLTTSLLVLPLWFLLFKLFSTDNIIGITNIIGRMLLVIVSIISTLPQLEPMIRIVGVLGLIVGVSLYTITGRWYLFPLDAIWGYQRERYRALNLLAPPNGPNNTTGTATGATGG